MEPNTIFLYITIAGICLFFFGMLAGSDIIDLDGDMDGDLEFLGMFSITSTSFLLTIGGATCFALTRHGLVTNSFYLSGIFLVTGLIAVYCYKKVLSAMKLLDQVNTIESTVGKVGTVQTGVKTWDDNGEVWVVANGKKTLFRARLCIKSVSAVQSTHLKYGTKVKVLEHKNNVLLVSQE